MKVKGLFEKCAATYKFRPNYPEEFYQEIMTRFDGLKSSRVIDLGSGDGRIAFRLAELETEIFAADVSVGMLKIIQNTCEEFKYQRIHPVRCDATQLPFLSSSVDYVFIGQSFHWMNRKLVLHELKRVLRKNGKGVIFWIQPYDPLAQSIRISDLLISEYVAHYHPETAHNLSLKSTIPHQSSFQIQPWNTEFTHHYEVDEYVNAVSSKSYVANSLDQDKIAEFKMRLSERLKQKGYTSSVKEKYSLTALFVKPESK